ncbi:ribonuclease J [Bacteriovoracaceae bacterium]|nr:ribonuclease J [Bacteriovoracaceae bacterium]
MSQALSEYNFQRCHFQLTPVGGVNQIGSNCTLFETKDDFFIIDYGILFPNDGFLNINYLIPNYNYIKTSKPINLIITHGHEDHIGGIFHLITNLKIDKIYAPKFAAELIRKKKLKNSNFPIEIFKKDDVINFKDVDIHPIYVNHSIPDTFGLIIKSRKDYFDILFISDFKVNQNPIGKDNFQFDKIKKLFSPKIPSFYFLDSTNALNPNKTAEEVELLPDLKKILIEKRKIFITLFASNVERIGNIIDLCEKLKKNLFVLGRSLEDYIQVAKDTGNIVSNKTIHRFDEYPAGEYDPTNCVFLVSGCQGDFFSALTRLSNEMVKEVKVEPNDLVVFSSKVIPGNEKNIYHLYNTFTKLGAEVIDSRDYNIHASGHASQGDIKLLLSEFQPNYYYPIHGETYFLSRHKNFINKNYHKIKADFITNFDIIRFNQKNKIIVEKTEPMEPILVHGKQVEISRETLRERRKVAQNGIILLFLDRSFNFHHIDTIGLVIPDDFTPKRIKTIIKTVRARFSPTDNSEKFKEELRITTRKLYFSGTGIKPITKIYLNDIN